MKGVYRYEKDLGDRIDITWQLDFRVFWEYLCSQEEWYVGVIDGGT